jgi:acyl carrier protein
MDMAATTADETISKMSAIWGEVLAIDSVAVDDDFFGLGGDSLLATTLMSHVQEAFGIQLNPMEVFEHSTLQALSSLVDRTILETAPAQSAEQLVI